MPPKKTEKKEKEEEKPDEEKEAEGKEEKADEEKETEDKEEKPAAEKKEDKEAEPGPPPEGYCVDKAEDVVLGTTRVAKAFKKGKRNTVFYGTVTEKWEEDGKANWSIKYDDDDTEDFNEEELEESLKLYKDKEKSDTKYHPKKKPDPKKKRKKVEPTPPPPRTSKYPKRGGSK